MRISAKMIGTPSGGYSFFSILLYTPNEIVVKEKQRMSHFFAYLSRMKHIKRWGLMRNTQEENIQEHSLQTAMIAHALAIIRNRLFDGSVDAERVMAFAVYHEAGEVITGDLATPIKYFNPEIKTAYKAIEALAVEKLLGMLPQELKSEYEGLLELQSASEEEHAIVKAADKICAYLKCVEELKAGNSEFKKAKATIEKDLKQSPLPEVQYFMKEFTPSFSLTLDELN
jgi:5'-deoxynucleotidase